MNIRNQWLVVGGVVAVLAGGMWVAAAQLNDELFPIRIGGQAPDFSAVTLPTRVADTASRATTVTAAGAGTSDVVAKGIDDYAGEVVLLNIWATWCGPCRIEMPSMERLEKRLGPKGLKIVAVSVDDPGMEQRMSAFAEELGLTFEILHDAPGRIRQTYQTTGVPETFIIGRDGLIRRRIIGADDWSSDANVAFLERLLAEPRP